MWLRRILSIVLLILGAGIYIYGGYMSDAAAQGEQSVSQAEENVQDQRQPLFGPIRKNVREQATENAQEEINEKGQIVAKSQISSTWLQGTGIAIIIIGIGCLAFSFGHKKSD